MDQQDASVEGGAETLVADLYSRSKEVAEAAERAVEGLDPASTEGESAELTAVVIEQMRRVRDECVRVNEILERVSDSLPAGAVTDGEHAEPKTPERPAIPSSKFAAKMKEPPAPIAYPGTAARTDGPSEGVRLLATQMAVAGSSVVEIERRLRADFGVDDAEGVVQDLFGTR